MVARGLVLPVLVALRQIGPGEWLIREPGAEEREKSYLEAWGYVRRVRRWDDKQLGMLLGHREAEGT